MLVSRVLCILLGLAVAEVAYATVQDLKIYVYDDPEWQKMGTFTLRRRSPTGTSISCDIPLIYIEGHFFIFYIAVVCRAHG